MIDRFNRRIEYARISITDRCNLRCRYCMSENGIEKISPKDVLTYEEIIHVTKIFSQLGIKKSASLAENLFSERNSAFKISGEFNFIWNRWDQFES